MRVQAETSVPPGWDERLASAGREGTFLQTSHWADLVRDVDRVTPIFLTVQDGAAVVGTALVLHRRPFDRSTRRVVRSPAAVVHGTHRGWLDFSAGPVVYVPDRAAAVTQAVLDWIENTSRSRGFTRAATGGFAPTSASVSRPELDSVFVRFGYRVSTWATYLTDLSGDEEQLWMRIDQSARKAVKKAQREGAVVEEVRTWEAYESQYARTYNACERRDGRVETPMWVFDKFWHHPARRFYRYYVAVDPTGTVLGTLGMFLYAGTATEINSSLTSAAFESKTPAQDLLHWRVLLDARAADCHTFDLAGVNPAPGTPKEAGIRRFKEKWGGDYMEFSRHEREFPTWIARLARLTRSVVGR